MVLNIDKCYKIENSESVVSILRKMKEYDIKYQVEILKGYFYVKCFRLDLGQQNIMSGFGKVVKKINWY